MDTSKIIRGIVNARGYTVTKAITQWDYGYVFVPEFEDLPPTYRLDFSNDEHHGTALPVYCGSEGGEVPEELIDTGKDIFVWFFYIGDGFGKSTYEWRIPNHCKPKTEQDEPTPSQQSSIDQLITRSNEAVERAEEAQEAIENMSVSATTLAEGESATVTKTESEGVVHLEFGIPKGQTGDSPTITASKTGDTTHIYADGIEIAQIKDGQDGSGAVEDVQINGTSILNDGTANIPIAYSQLGAVFVSPSVGDTGLDINSQGIISTFPAPTPFVKGGSNGHMPITPNHQHESVFYGLAKAGGDTSQAQSANPVGTYTDDAKDAIRAMLDVPSNDDIPTVNVDDVEMDGVSIVQNGVASIPVGTDTTVGVVRADGNFGTGVYNKRVFVARAYADHIKAGTHSYRPITPICQHESTFYGLAKAAGDTTQSQSSNAVGNYTDETKGKIQTMLGIADLIGNSEGATASKAYSVGDVFQYNGKLYEVTASIASGSAIVPNTNCTQTTIIDLLRGV